MSKFTDQEYLKTDQYKDSSNLDARVAIHQRFSTNSYGWMNWVFDHLLTLPADAKILELGSGTGLLWKENANRIPSAWDITLSDLSAGMLDSTWRNLVVPSSSKRSTRSQFHLKTKPSTRSSLITCCIMSPTDRRRLAR